MKKLVKDVYWKTISCRNKILANISQLLFDHSAVKKSDIFDLRNLKDIHKGRRAFIVCNGPSLKAEDLNVLQKYDEISFAANLILPMIRITNWTPTYYSVADSSGIYTLRSTMSKISAKIKFFPIDGYIVGKFIKGKCLFFNSDGNRKYLEEPRFSEDCSNIIYCIGTVTYVSLQLAVYMGIKELYIIGCDNRYGAEIRKDGTKVVYEGSKNYFEGVKKKFQKGAGNSWEQTIAFEAAKKYADEHGIKIYNATRGGYLETFERVDFDSLFEKR